MARIAGVDLPNEKRVDIGLTYLYGVGRANVVGILKAAGIAPNRRIKELSDEEVGKLAKLIEKEHMVEGDLRRFIGDNIKRLKEAGSYRGLRHMRGLPSRGQRTRSNARTKRGKRKTIGAMKKDDRVKLETPAAEKK